MKHRIKTLVMTRVGVLSYRSINRTWVIPLLPRLCYFDYKVREPGT